MNLRSGKNLQEALSSIIIGGRSVSTTSTETEDGYHTPVNFLAQSTPIWLSPASDNSEISEEINSKVWQPSTLKQLATNILNYSFPSIPLVKTAMEKFNMAMSMIPTFSGKSGDLHKFITCCKIAYTDFKTVPEKTTFMNIMKLKLQGAAYEIVKYRDFDDFETLEIELNKQFLEKRSFEQIQNELFSTKQRHRESCLEYSNRIERLYFDLNTASMQKISPNASADTKREITSLNASIALQTFQNNLREPIRTIIKASRYTSLGDAAKAAINEEIYSVAISSNTPKVENHNRHTTCSNCGKPGHSISQCYAIRNRMVEKPTIKVEQPNYKKIFCVYCKRKNHTVNNCRILAERNKSKPANVRVGVCENPPENGLGQDQLGVDPAQTQSRQAI